MSSAGAMTASTVPHYGNAPALVDRLRAKAGPLAAIVIAHAALFYFAYSGLAQRVVRVALPEAMYVSLVAPPPAAPPATTAQAAPRVAQVQPPPLPAVPAPVLNIAPPENAVRMPPAAAAAPAERAPVVVAAVSAAPPAPPSSAPRTITSGVEYLQAPRLVYPPMSKRMGEQGRVILRVLVNEKGWPDQVLVQSSSGSARLDEAGRQAALHALFKPYIEDGRPVAVYVIVPLNFQLA
jgi:protein TonB